MVCFAIIVFASCSEDEPAKMLWEVTATPAESVKAAFDPSFYHQIQITADGEGGEVTLKCTNYKSLNLVGAKNGKGEWLVPPKMRTGNISMLIANSRQKSRIPELSR